MNEHLHMMRNKLKEFEAKVDGYKLTTHGRRTVINLSNIITHIHEMDKKWHTDTPSFSPFFAFNEESQAMWAALWSGLYLELSKDGDIPLEAMHCMKLKVLWKDEDDLEYQLIDVPTNGFYFHEGLDFCLRCDGSAPPLIDEVHLRETYYVFALFGVQEGWWDSEILEALPPREDEVLEFMFKSKSMKKAVDILDMLDGTPDVTLKPSPNDDSPLSGECEE